MGVKIIFNQVCTIGDNKESRKERKDIRVKNIPKKSFYLLGIAHFFSLHKFKRYDGARSVRSYM